MAYLSLSATKRYMCMHICVREEVFLFVHDCVFVCAKIHSCIYFTYVH